MRTMGASSIGLAAVILVSGVSNGCGGTPASPGPVVPGLFVNIAGNWTGTLESANLPSRTLAMTVVQTSSCVDGVWKDSLSEWTGAISGFAGADAFSGQISLERSDAGGKCTAVGNITGPADKETLNWTSTGFSAVGQCTGALPQSVTLTLRRQP